MIPDNDQDLQRACSAEFARVEAPKGFAERVIARISASERSPAATLPVTRAHAWRPVAVPRRAAIAAMLLVSAAGAGLWRSAEQQRLESEAARRDLGVAMHITQEKLAEVRARIERDLWPAGGSL